MTRRVILRRVGNNMNVNSTKSKIIRNLSKMCPTLNYVKLNMDVPLLSTGLI